jgi:hypothetical protein
MRRRRRRRRTSAHRGVRGVGGVSTQIRDDARLPDLYGPRPSPGEGDHSVRRAALMARADIGAAPEASTMLELSDSSLNKMLQTPVLNALNSDRFRWTESDSVQHRSPTVWRTLAHIALLWRDGMRARARA